MQALLAMSFDAGVDIALAFDDEAKAEHYKTVVDKVKKYVLGVNVVAPGCEKIKIEPHLGDLEWVEGIYPTPYGIVYIKHTKDDKGNIKSDIKSPKEVEIIENY